MKKYITAIFLIFSTISQIEAFLYQGVSGGGSAFSVEQESKGNFDMRDEGFSFGMSLGYDPVDYPFRFEQQISSSKHYFDSDVVLGAASCKKDSPIYSFSFTENIFVDQTFDKFTAYIGAGIGGHFSRGKGRASSFDDKYYEYTVIIKKLIFQGTFGIKSQLPNDMWSSLEYRYKFCHDNSLNEHGVFFGLFKAINFK